MPPSREGIAVHAASVGEVNAAAPLIRALQQHMPDVPLIVTTFTPTGSRRVQALFGQRVFHVFAPLDLPGAVRRFLARVRPRIIVVLEREIWPNLYARADRLGVPVLLANTRLSERSASRYARTGALMVNTLGRVAWAGAQTAADAERLVRCGAAPERIEITGNLKFELALPPGLPKESRALRASWGVTRPVLTAGSSRATDEDILLPAFRELLDRLPDALLILVPRHPERFAEVTDKARAAGFRVAVRSEGAACAPGTQVFVIDAMGELMRYYAAGDLAFVGGTFGSAGGHNLLEPAALGKPILFGPNTRNAEEIAERLVKEGAAVRVGSGAEFRAAAQRWLRDPVAREAAGQAALWVVEQGRGALQRHLAVIQHYLGQ
jgi:3-deoxy-D-manno-octulosonic-acid transferase